MRAAGRAPLTRRSAYHRFTPVQRLVLGMSRRDKEEFIPQMLEVLEAKPPDNNRMLVVPNPDVEDFTTYKIFRETHGDMDEFELMDDAAKREAKRRRAINLNVNCDLEDRYFLRMCDRLGVPNTDATFHVAFPSALRRAPQHGPWERAGAGEYPNLYVLEARRDEKRADMKTAAEAEEDIGGLSRRPPPEAPAHFDSDDTYMKDLLAGKIKVEPSYKRHLREFWGVPLPDGPAYTMALDRLEPDGPASTMALDRLEPDDEPDDAPDDAPDDEEEEGDYVMVEDV